MSVFHVYDGTVGDPDALYLGMGKAARRFAAVFNAGDAKKIFETLIYDVIYVDGCTVTYEDENGDEWVVNATKSGMNIKISYQDSSGNEVTLNLKAEQDDPNNKNVTMAVPSREVLVTDPYLTEAVVMLASKPDYDNQREAFLLGMLLLRRCR